MPPHERVGPHNGQELAPCDEAREQDEGDSRGVVSAVWRDLAFDVTGQLLSEEEVLRSEVRSGSDHKPQQAQQVSEEGECRSEHVG